MQYKQLAAVAAFAGFANAQSQCASIVPQLPACLLGYVASAAYYGQGCGIPDIQCQAGNDEHYTSIVEAAIPAAAMRQDGAASACDGSIQLDALDIGSSLTSCAKSFSAEPAVTLNALQSACQPLALSINPCALGFIAEVAYSSYSCAVQDFECQCKNFNNLQGAVANDVIAYCGANGLTPVINSAQALCSCVTSQLNGAGPTTTGDGPTTTGTGPTSSGSSSSGSSSSGSSASSASPSGSVPTGPTQTGGPTSSGSSSKSGSVSTGPSGSQSSGASKSGGNSATTSGPPVQSGPGGNNGGSKSMPLFTNAGPTASAFGGMLGVVAGVVAFL